MREISVATRSGSSGTVRARVVWIGVLLLTLWAGFLSGQQGFPRNQALYVTMRDGVKIAIDVWLPASLEPDQEIPTVLRATRDGADFLGRHPPGHPRWRPDEAAGNEGRQMLTVAADSAARIDRVRGEFVFILRGLRSTVAAGTGPVINRLVRAAADLGRARDAARLGGA